MNRPVSPGEADSKKLINLAGVCYWMELLELLLHHINLLLFLSKYNYVVHIEHYNQASIVDKDTWVCCCWLESNLLQEIGDLSMPQIHRLA